MKDLNSKQSNILLVVLALLFFGFGFIAMQNAKPFPKEERIYALIAEHFPYTIEKRVGGFTIVFKDTGEKVKPSNEEFFKKIESIDKFWAKTHLQIEQNGVVIVDINKNVIKQIPFINIQEKEFVKNYFAIGVNLGK